MHKEPKKVDVRCPECREHNIVLWFPWEYGEWGSDKKEKVEGKCKKCSYKFTPDDLD
ncbi:MAG: hypothetical protein ABH821_05455 [archaeon]